MGLIAYKTQDVELRELQIYKNITALFVANGENFQQSFCIYSMF
jgi:hypothetical protein